MILFLGSGVSLASGLPGVLTLTDDLLEGAFCYDPGKTGSFHPVGEQGDRDFQPLDKVQRLLRILADIDKHYLDTAAPYVSGSTYKRSGSIYRSVTTYEDLFQMCMQLKQNGLGLTEMEMGVLCAIAYLQPIDRAGLKDIFGKEVGRDLLARLRLKDLIASDLLIRPRTFYRPWREFSGFWSG